ncbi:unnamed protein product [Linum trigynum]|uniref:Uncharacterized protein n=1 Tax=Linum trigynum TaxID=586398 RepID=A0AAV2GQM0_9ROSI
MIRRCCGLSSCFGSDAVYGFEDGNASLRDRCMLFLWFLPCSWWSSPLVGCVFAFIHGSKFLCGIMFLLVWSAASGFMADWFVERRQRSLCGGSL